MTSPARSAHQLQPDSPDSARPRWDHRWLGLGLIGLGALVLRVPAIFAPTQLGYDDGGYGLAAVAMRQGFAPFRDIFSPQGPLFLPLVRIADLAGLEHRNAPRLIAVIAGIVTAIGVYAIAVQIMDRGRATLAGALAATSGLLLWTTGPLTGDGPAAAWATTAVAVAVSYRRSPSRTKAAVIMMLIGAAFATKSLVVAPAVMIAWALVVTRRRWLEVVLIPIGALAIVVALAAPWGIQNVLDDYLRYHLDKTAERKPLHNLDRMVRAFAERDTFLTGLAAAGLAAAIVRRVRDRGEPPPPADPTPQPRWRSAFDADRFLWWWIGITVVVLLAQDPLFRNHFSALVAPAALLVARARPSWRWVAIVGLVTVPVQVMVLRPVLFPSDYHGVTARIVDGMRVLPRSAWALSDEPGLVWRAGLGTDPFFVDPSALRMDSTVGSIKITESRIVRAASKPRMCAVVINSTDRFGRYRDLPHRLVALGYRQTIVRDGPLGLYLREPCRPTEAHQ